MEKKGGRGRRADLFLYFIPTQTINWRQSNISAFFFCGNIGDHEYAYLLCHQFNFQIRLQSANIVPASFTKNYREGKKSVLFCTCFFLSPLPFPNPFLPGSHSSLLYYYRVCFSSPSLPLSPPPSASGLNPNSGLFC